nr:MAG TPA: hypothetical protein [Caudoviricetes sp.]
MYSYLAHILYHLHDSRAIGTYFRWLLFLYIKFKKEMMIWH